MDTNMMKKTSALFIFTLNFFTFNTVQAELNAVIQAEYAEKTIHNIIKEKDVAGESEFNGDTSAAVFGITISERAFYANLTAEFPLRDHNDYQREFDSTFILSRKDYAFTVGYNVSKYLSIFTGYKYGKTEADITTYIFSPSPDTLLNTNTIKERGPFIGASTSININNKNIISLSAAYADMEGEFRNNLNPTGGSGTGLANSKGDTDGYSISVKWLHQMSDDTLINLGYKINNYDNDWTSINGGQIEGTSEYNYYSIGLTHFF